MGEENAAAGDGVESSDDGGSGDCGGIGEGLAPAAADVGGIGM